MSDNLLPILREKLSLQKTGFSKPTTISILIMDASGSMQDYHDVPQECLNKHLEGLKNPPDGRDQFCSIVGFNNEYFVLLPMTDAQQAPKITNYAPDHSTLLYKTVYHVIRWMIEMAVCKEDPNRHLIVGVFSDGMDNKSPPEYLEKLRKYASMATDAGIDLYTFGIGINGQALARKMD
ncbi:MAG: vWA domain-containing protein, partial [Patescibacteria group bacterium]